MGISDPCPTETDVEDALLGLLSPDRCVTVQRHVETCEGCRLAYGPTKALMTDLRAAGQRLDDLAAEGPLVERVVAQLRDVVAADLFLPASPSAGDTRHGAADRTADPVAETGDAPLWRIGNYELIELVGKGGMGRVYKARHCRMNRVVAVKILSARRAGSADSVARFHREVQAAAKLIHPNIVTAFDADEADGEHFLVMEYVQGANLADLIDHRGACTVAEALRYTLDAARGLAFAHSRGVVHRDIKPGNLVLDERGTVKILDLGLARLEADGRSPIRTDLTETGEVMGTVDFMPPEQALKTKNADARSDIYSLGATLWYLATGTPMFAGDSVVEKLMGHQVRPIPSLAEVHGDLPHGLDDVIARMVAKKPSDRYQSMTEVIDELERLLSEQTDSGIGTAWSASPHGVDGGPLELGGQDRRGRLASGGRWLVAPARSESRAMETTVPCLASGIDTFPSVPRRRHRDRWLTATSVRGIKPVTIIVGSLASIVLGTILASRFSGQPTPVPVADTRPSGGLVRGAAPVDNTVPPTSGHAHPQPVEWRDVTETFSREMVVLKRAELVDGVLQVTRNGFAADMNGGQEYRDVAVRITGSGSFYPYVRRLQKRLRYSAAGDEGGSIALVDEDKALKVDRGAHDPAFDRHADHQMTVMAKGDEITLWIDGVRKATLRDFTIARGSIGFGAWGDDVPAGRVRIRKVEYADLAAVATAASSAAATSATAHVDPASTDVDCALQGEYAGEIPRRGQLQKHGVQAVALGDGRFELVAYPGGLPGAGWTPPVRVRGTGIREGADSQDRVRCAGLDVADPMLAVEIREGALLLLGDDGREVARLPRVERNSPTLGQPPPADAVVIFDGAGTVDEVTTLKEPRLTDDGLLMEGVTTTGLFGDARWHIEFRLPYQPAARGQRRGNSGVFISSAYEVQVLDSFGLETTSKECGSIFDVAAPSVNMCLPPLSWQTFDIEFTAPRFEGRQKVKNAVMTVRHNGVLIHDHVEVPGLSVGSGLAAEQPTGPLHLQLYDSPVRYRNIWVQPKS